MAYLKPMEGPTDEKSLLGEKDQKAVLTMDRWSRRTVKPRPRYLNSILLACAVLALLAFTTRPDWQRFLARDVTNPETENTFNWAEAPTLPHLQYEPCYEDFGDFQCARLGVPLDYWNGTTNATLSLAVIRKPAVVAVNDPRYGGAVLLNPGGPGGSGIFLVLFSGNKIRSVIDSPLPSLSQKNGKYYDLISFDPRGVGQTTPSFSCFDDPSLATSWQIRTMQEGVFGSSDAAFGRLWAMSIAFSKSCSRPAIDGEVDVRPYVSTASVARDMVSIVESHGEWRMGEAKRLIAQEKGIKCNVATSAIEVPEAVKYKPGEEKIQYWGFSYGTYLGLTFAAMFPDRIHRLIVDGVVDAYDYRQVLWKDNLLDTEKDMHTFYYHCARAGYPSCALANHSGETTVESVEARVKNITMSLVHNPLPVIGDNAEVITYSDVKLFIFQALYTPIQSFPFVANILADIEAGDGTAFAEILMNYHRMSAEASAAPATVPFATPFLNKIGPGAAPGDATMAIACSDGDDQSWLSKDEFNDFWQELEEMSPSVGAIWASIRLACVHYSVRSVHRFVDPWVGNTSHPILLVGNTADPVTPLDDAHKMSKGFPGSVVLTQDSAGHCTLSAPSLCTSTYIRKYMQSGEMPPKDTVCEADEFPFGGR